MVVAGALLLCVAAGGTAHAAKTDVLVLRNGDRITGEVKGLDRGQLEYSTDDAGTIYVEWAKVASLIATRVFDIELDSGRRLYGALQPAPSVGLLRIAGHTDTSLVGVLSVVHIQPLEKSLLKQLDGSVDLGLYLARANRLFQFSVDFVIEYRTRERIATLSGSSQETHQDSVADVNRSNLTLSYAKVLTNRWFAQASTGSERNSELGIDLRASLGLFGGRYLIQSNSSLLGVGLGFSGNRENPGTEDSRWNIEAVVGAGWALFGYDFPKTNVTIDAKGYRDLSRNRVRAEGNINAKREVIKDFTVGIIANESYDSDPPAGGTNNDWTLKFTIGWTY